MRDSSRLILLVEDNEDEVLLMKRAIAKAEVDVILEVVRDGEAAIQRLASADPAPAFVLLDLKLPKRSGFEVLESLQDRPGRVPPVIVFSNSAEERDVRRGYALGASSYVTKPTAFSDLIELVRSLCAFWLAWNTSPPTTSAS